jgi:hypothetical protein
MDKLEFNIYDIPLINEFIDINEAYLTAKNDDRFTVLDLTEPEYHKLSKKWKHKANYTFRNKHIIFAYDPVLLGDHTSVYFTEAARFKANVRGYDSAFDYYNKNRRRIDNLARKYTKEGRTLTNSFEPFAYNKNRYKFWIREIIYSEIKIPTITSILQTKILCQFAQAKTYLDPSAGWGDRVIGASVADVKVYHGFDPNTNLANAYKEILQFLGQKEYQIWNRSFLDNDIILTDNYYDLVYTSPPFWDFEVYSSDEGQSINEKKDVQEWKDDFYFHTVGRHGRL